MEINIPIENIVTDLRNNISDPVRRDGQWIHFDNISEVGKTPAVFIELAPSTPEDLFGDQVDRLNILIHVVTKDAESGFVNNDYIEKNSDKLRNEIVKLITNRLESQHSLLKCWFKGISGTFPLGANKKVTTLRYEVLS